ncbi:MAG: zinc-ribbon domain-containing protein [Acidobacteriota bacterium]|nr:MAG: zinc-ribbon domain-containing protein [Acidobacteriota bacterium]
MVIQCPSCQSKYKYPEERFEGASKKKVKCKNCGGTFEIENPAGSADGKSTGEVSSQTKRIDAGRRTVSAEDAALHGIPLLPDDRKLSLSVLDGPMSGTVFPIKKPIITLGRANADLTLEDPESSRLHAQIEIHGYKYIIKDLNSTNGTFVGDKRVKEGPLENLTEFRVGSTSLMFIETRITDEPEPE